MESIHLVKSVNLQEYLRLIGAGSLYLQTLITTGTRICLLAMAFLMTLQTWIIQHSGKQSLREILLLILMY